MAPSSFHVDATCVVSVILLHSLLPERSLTDETIFTSYAWCRLNERTDRKRTRADANASGSISLTSKRVARLGVLSLSLRLRAGRWAVRGQV